MSDYFQNFEFILKKQSKKKPSALYCDNINLNQTSFKPQDVITSISRQLKAIQDADSSKKEKRNLKDLRKYKNAKITSVSNLSVEETEFPKQTAKFDTQCFSNTQLINVIEDAEILAAHQGMTQEIETAFLNTYTEIQSDKQTDKCDIISENHGLEACKMENAYTSNMTVSKDSITIKTPNYRNKVKILGSTYETAQRLESDKLTHGLNEDKFCDSKDIDDDAKYTINNLKKDIQKHNVEAEQLSQVLVTRADNFKIKKCISPKLGNKNNKENLPDSEIERYTPLSTDIEIYHDVEPKDRPPSPIFMTKIHNIKSKSPSPLVFNLDQFEHFESIAMSLLETNNFDMGKHIINSQILNKELCFNNKEIELVHSHIDTSNKKDDKPNPSITPVLETDKEMIEIEKEILKNVDQKTKFTQNKTDASQDLFQDEILFSSDEEDDYIHKEGPDLPFTCALETSFYNQSDVLDKTVYVGFQTANNRSIQVGADSFAIAQSILGDFTCDELTITELVNNCEGSIKGKDENDINIKENSLHFDEYAGNPIKRDFEVPSKVGFKTANNKKIELSKKALDRCKKVFQDIDLDETFDCRDDKDVIEGDIKGYHFNNKESDHHTSFIDKASNNTNAMETVNNILEGFDDEIVQEFVNIDMSLENLNEAKKSSSNNDEINPKSLATVEDIVINAPFHKQINKICKDSADIVLSQILGSNRHYGDKISSKKSARDVSDNIKIKNDDHMLTSELLKVEKKPERNPKVTSETGDDQVNSEIYDTLPSTSIGFVGFRTANNKKITISEKAFLKSKALFNDIDSTDFPRKNNKDYPNDALRKECDVELEEHKPHNRTSLAGFRAANNKNIEVSQKSVGKTKTVFNDINLTDVLPDKPKGHPDREDTENGGQLLEGQLGEPVEFIGFKSASNKIIKVSEKAVAQTKSIFNGINIEFSKAPYKENKNPQKISDLKIQGCKTANNENIQDDLPQIKDICKDIDSAHFGCNAILENINKDDNLGNTGFIGFQTASNKKLKISEKALAKSRKMFQDFDTNDDLSVKTKNIKTKSLYPKEILQENEVNINDFEAPINRSETCFKGFQTASKKPVAISKSALEKSKKLFRDLDDENLTPIEEWRLKENEKIVLNEQSTANNKVNFQGFQTASKKPVTISKTALEKSKKLFEDLHEEGIGRLDDFNFEEKTKAVSEIETTSDNIMSFKGFQTASKKPVAISKEALERSKKLFKDLDEQIENFHSEEKRDDVSDKEYNADKVIGVKAFQTASKKPVVISKEALERSKKLFKDLDEPNVRPIEDFHLGEKRVDVSEDEYTADKVTSFKGFQTASKKPVVISKAALEKSKKLFQDLDEDNLNTIEPPKELDVDNTTNFKGFLTASKKPVAISKDALEISKQLFKDLDEANLKPIEEFHPEENKEILHFKGFQTASHQKVTINEHSFAKVKEIFNYIDSKNNQVKEATVKPFNIGFQTANKKTSTVSEEALAKTKRLFSEIDEECNINIKKKDKKVSRTEDVEIMLDTQVLNNFEKSLYTEDFAVSPKTTKRSTSPILSCPRAKKRKKFEVPYNLKQIPECIPKNTEISAIKNNFICYREDYKKNNSYKLKDIDNMAKHIPKRIDPYLLSLKYENLLNFEFDAKRNDLSNDKLTITKLKEEFTNSVNAKLIPNGWLENHLRQILWKLISYEIKFNSLIVCTARNVLEQLKYRYDKELYNAQRPVLRKIFEKDDVPSKTMVLCVVGIYVDDVLVSSLATASSNIELLLTDGWYTVRCKIDKMLTNLVCNGKIIAGTKIAMSGAELIGCEQGVSPWEDTSSIRLKLSGNSTRRAKWDARLGYHTSTILSPLSTIQVLGGKIAKLRVLVTRVYPALYVEKFEDGSTVTRSERLESIHQMKTEAERQALMEKLYEEVEKEFADQASQDSEVQVDCKRPCMDSGSQIAKMMKLSKDPSEFRATLTDSQIRLLEAYSSKNRDRLLQDIQTRLKDKIEKSKVCINRNVVCLLKIRVADVIEKGDSVHVCKGMMSIWKPNDAILEVIKEGAWIDVLNVIPTAVRYSEIQLSASRQSIFNTSKYKEPDKFKPYTKLLNRQLYTLKDLSQNPAMTTDYNEIDTIGLIFLIEPSIKEFDSTKQPFQNVYLADLDKNIICANFWGGLQKFGYQNVLDIGQVIVCGNLQKRAGNTRKSIPQFRVTEFSYFTRTPKNVIAKNMLDGFNRKLSGLDRRKLCQECVALKNSFLLLKNNENISPYRFMNNDLNKNKIFIDSPLTRANKMDDNFNLTGLDFESTFKQDTQLSEEMLKRKKKVNEKIARLKMYGEPPPLSPIHIINRSNHASSSYKSPLQSNTNNSYNIHNNSKTVNPNFKCVTEEVESCVNVTRAENTPQKCGVQSEISSSSVLLNRTYIKSVNPVKINFDVIENNDTVIDHFADEFDGSPPLSLD